MKLSQQAGWKLCALRRTIVYQAKNAIIHERSELTSILTSTLTPDLTPN